MPKINVKLCPRCFKKICHGSIWKIVSIVPISGPNKGVEIIGEYIDSDFIKPKCHLSCFGRRSTLKGMTIPKNYPIKTRVTRLYNNWNIPYNVTYEKVED